MVQRELVICNKLGLHARAAAKLARLASSFQSEILLGRPGRNEFINAKSILGVLMMAAADGTPVTVTIEGRDEAAAAGAIEELINNRFGERE
jgi:phosphocarrier protein HPr